MLLGLWSFCSSRSTWWRTKQVMSTRQNWISHLKNGNYRHLLDEPCKDFKWKNITLLFPVLRNRRQLLLFSLSVDIITATIASPLLCEVQIYNIQTHSRETERCYLLMNFTLASRFSNWLIWLWKLALSSKSSDSQRKKCKTFIGKEMHFFA